MSNKKANYIAKEGRKMNRLLTQDQDIFEAKFPEALSFLRGAHLRHEAFSLLHRDFQNLNQWEKDRLVELMQSPACQTQWFERIKEKRWKESLVKASQGKEMRKLQQFAELVEAQKLEELSKMGYTHPGWEKYAKVFIKPGKTYAKIDLDTSGKFMVDGQGNIFGIKAYGVINRKKHYGTLDTIHEYFWGGYAPIKRKDTP